MICTPPPPTKYYSGSQIKQDGISRACGIYGGEKRNAYMVLLRIPGEDRPLGRPTHGQNDNIKMTLKDDDWITMGQDMDKWQAVVNTLLNLQVQ